MAINHRLIKIQCWATFVGITSEYINLTLNKLGKLQMSDIYSVGKNPMLINSVLHKITGGAITINDLFKTPFQREKHFVFSYNIHKVKAKPQSFFCKGKWKSLVTS